MPVFPVLPLARLTRTAQFATDVIRYGNGKEQRIRRDPLPRWHFEFDLRIVPDSEKQQLENLFLACQGRVLPLDFVDPDPHSVTCGTSYTVRFAQDQISFDYFSYRLWNLSRLTLIED